MSCIRLVAVPLLALVLAACGGRPAAPEPAAAAPAAQAEASAQLGDATVHVSAVQTSQLPEAVARRYGIARSPRSVLLLVNLQGGDGAVPVRIEALGTVTPIAVSVQLVMAAGTPVNVTAPLP